MESVKGRVYAITGLAGIGLAVAKLLHSHGAILSLADKNPDVLQAAVKTLQGTDDTIYTETVDITSSASVNVWIDATVSRFGRLDGAANMAGVIGKHHGTGKLIDIEDSEWDLLLSVNMTGLMYCLRAEIKAISKTAPDGKGSIVNASSVQGWRGFPLHAAYSATKHGVEGLSKSIAKEVGPHIRINTVAPGAIQTPLLDQANAIQGQAPTTPTAIDRIGTAPEVANVVGFLLSDSASYVTGARYQVDGGWDP